MISVPKCRYFGGPKGLGLLGVSRFRFQGQPMVKVSPNAQERSSGARICPVSVPGP